MATLKQIAANRANARRSTGPTSVTGKAASSRNAFKTGLHSKSLLVHGETQADLDLLIDEYYTHHHPASPEARAFLDELIRCEWLLRRFDAIDAQMVHQQNDFEHRDPEKFPLGRSATAFPGTFSKLQYRIECTRRARNKALEAFRELQAQPTAQPAVRPEAFPPAPDLQPSAPPTHSPQTASHEIGFVLQPGSTPPEIPAPPDANPALPHLLK